MKMAKRPMHFKGSVRQYVSCISRFSVLCLLIFAGCKKQKDAQSVPSEHGSEQSDSDPEAMGRAEQPPFMEAGQRVYEQYCLVCHQANGKGVSGLNPPLINTEYVIGDKDRLLGIIVKGSNVGLVVQGTTYANAMPGFNALEAEELANVSSYIRNSFGNSADPITEAEVITYRSNNQQ